jgi:hypothetical protein
VTVPCLIAEPCLHTNRLQRSYFSRSKLGRC